MCLHAMLLPCHGHLDRAAECQLDAPPQGARSAVEDELALVAAADDHVVVRRDGDAADGGRVALQLGEERLAARHVPDAHEAVVAARHERGARVVAPLRADAVDVVGRVRRVVLQLVERRACLAHVENVGELSVSRRLQVHLVGAQREDVDVAHARADCGDFQPALRAVAPDAAVGSAGEHVLAALAHTKTRDVLDAWPRLVQQLLPRLDRPGVQAALASSVCHRIQGREEQAGRLLLPKGEVARVAAALEPVQSLRSRRVPQHDHLVLAARRCQLVPMRVHAQTQHVVAVPCEGARIEDLRWMFRLRRPVRRRLRRRSRRRCDGRCRRCLHPCPKRSTL
eukprot:6193740-Pleurochrysis_carterae.AAC.1